MLASTQQPIGNRVLSMLSPPEYRRLEPRLERVVLASDSALYAPGDVIKHIYFPVDCVVSLLFDVDSRRGVEVAMEGNESAVGLAMYLGGARSCNLSVVRDGGSALRLEVGALESFTRGRGRLQGLLHKSVHGLITQIAQSGVCSRFHRVDARLARWLMMTHDRLGQRRLDATQESIARLLGVRRSGVTAAAVGFQRDGLVDYRRGRIEILNPGRLRGASCACYGIIKGQYDSFLQ